MKFPPCKTLFLRPPLYNLGMVTSSHLANSSLHILLGQPCRRLGAIHLELLSNFPTENRTDRQLFSPGRRQAMIQGNRMQMGGWKGRVAGEMDVSVGCRRDGAHEMHVRWDIGRMGRVGTGGMEGMLECR